MNKIKKLFEVISKTKRTAVAMLTLAATNAFCTSLPTPAIDVSDGDYFTGFKKVMSSAYTFASESTTLIAFILFAVLLIVMYWRVHEKKATWFEFATTVAVGAVVLIIVFFLLNQGTSYQGSEI